MDAPPPLSLAFPTYVIEYAIVDASVTFHDRKNLWVGDEWLGAVPKLAICFNPRTKEYHLSHCDEAWGDLCSVETRKTISEIKHLAERRYEGIGAKWTPTDYSAEEAQDHFAAVEAEWQCSFCKKSPYDHDADASSGMAVSDNAKICYDCIRRFAAEIAGDNT